LNRPIDIGGARVGGRYSGIRSAGYACPVHVVSHYVRAGARHPGKVHAVLNRCYPTSGERLGHGRIRGIAREREIG